MKTALTLKTMITATLCCILLTLLEILFDRIVPIDSFSRHDFELTLGWIAVLIGWIVYFLERFRSKRKTSKEDIP